MKYWVKWWNRRVQAKRVITKVNCLSCYAFESQNLFATSWMTRPSSQIRLLIQEYLGQQPLFLGILIVAFFMYGKIFIVLPQNRFSSRFDYIVQFFIRFFLGFLIIADSCLSLSGSKWDLELMTNYLFSYVAASSMTCPSLLFEHLGR